jgi:SAM-dependent MidA family methyltransferase
MFVSNKSVWEVVEEYLKRYGKATCNELLDALYNTGVFISDTALRERIRKWRKEGRLVVKHRGRAGVALVFLAPTQPEE